MTTSRAPLLAGAAVLFAVLASHALAHSTVKRTVPASGSILPSSPAEVLIEFNEPARLTSLVVVTFGESGRKLPFEPAGRATLFTAKEPRLSKGRNEVQWKALSKDGHPISGTVIVVIKPSAEPDTGSSASDHRPH